MILILAKHEVEKQREPGKEQTVADLQQEMMEHHKVVLKCLLKKNPPGDPKDSVPESIWVCVYYSVYL